MTSFIRAVTAVMFTALLFVVAAPASAVTAGAEHMTVYDSAEEIEPALISQVRYGVDYVVTVYMKLNPDINAIPTLEYAAYNSNGASTHGALPTAGLTYYNAIFDPVLAQREGVTNPRIYLAAIGENEGLNSTKDTAVIIWSSDDGGWSWSAPSVIASEASASGKFDKTAIAVGPDGSVHVSWINTNPSNTLLYRSGTYNPSTDALTWSTDPPTNVLGATSNVVAPQVMVDTNCDVYILYVDGAHIRLVREDAAVTGVSFVPLNEMPNIGQLYGAAGVDDFITLKPGTPGVRIRAFTVPVARLDRTNRRIAVAWHEPDGSGHSQIRFASLETDGARTWSTPIVIAAAGGHDINVGMAKDDLGKWLVTYYSFPLNDSYYSPVGTTVYFSGDTPIHDNGNNRIIGRLGDIADLSSPGSGQRFLGEYHDVSYSLGTFKSAHIIVAPIANPWIFEATQ